MLRAMVGTIEHQSTLIAIVNRSESKSGRKSDGFFPRRKNGDVALVKRPAGCEIRVARVANGAGRTYISTSSWDGGEG